MSDKPFGISVIVPTIGRPHLVRTLESVVPDADEVLLVGDGQGVAPDEAAAFGPKVRYLETGQRSNDWGSQARNMGIAEARFSHLAFMDDDDVFLPNALPTMKRAAAKTSKCILLFRMVHMGDLIWKDQQIFLGNVSTHMFLIPNDKARIAVWKPNPDLPLGKGDDLLFIQETAALFGADHVVWRPEVVAELLQHANGEGA